MKNEKQSKANKKKYEISRKTASKGIWKLESTLKYSVTPKKDNLNIMQNKPPTMHWQNLIEEFIFAEKEILVIFNTLLYIISKFNSLYY